jgi:hypothetical protein
VEELARPDRDCHDGRRYPTLHGGGIGLIAFCPLIALDGDAIYQLITEENEHRG